MIPKTSKELPEGFYSDNELAAYLEVQKTGLDSALECLIQKGLIIAKLRKHATTTYFLPQESIEVALALLKGETMETDEKEFKMEPSERTMYGRNEGLLKKFLPLREKIRTLENQIGLSYEQISRISRFMQEYGFTEVETKRRLSQKDLSAVVEEFRQLKMEYTKDQNALVKENMGGLILMVNWFYRGSLRNQYELNELVSEAVAGFIVALKKYDASKGSILGYAAYWVKSKLQRNIIDKRRPIHFSGNIVRDAKKVSDYLNKRKKKGIWNLTEEDFQEIFPQKARTSPEELTSLLNGIQLFFQNKTLNVNGPISAKDWSRYRVSYEPLHYEDVLPQETFADAETSLEFNELSALLPLAFKEAKLNERELTILQGRFGDPDDENETFGSIGKKMGISSERSRQIQEKALKKLRDAFKKLGIPTQQRKSPCSYF